MEKSSLLNSKQKMRLMALVFFLFFLFSLILGQFFKLQILEQKKWQACADGQHYLITYEHPKRGVFYVDNVIQKGTVNEKLPLVLDMPIFSLCIDPTSIPSSYRNRFVTHLSKELELDEKEVALHFQKKYPF